MKTVEKITNIFINYIMFVSPDLLETEREILFVKKKNVYKLLKNKNRYQRCEFSHSWPERKNTPSDFTREAETRKNKFYRAKTLLLFSPIREFTSTSTPRLKRERIVTLANFPKAETFVYGARSLTTEYLIHDDVNARMNF